MQRTIEVKVFPKARREQVVEERGLLKVYIQAAAEKGKANTSLLEILAEYLGVGKSSLTIVKGATSRKKIIKVG